MLKKLLDCILFLFPSFCCKCSYLPFVIILCQGRELSLAYRLCVIHYVFGAYMLGCVHLSMIFIVYSLLYQMKYFSENWCVMLFIKNIQLICKWFSLNQKQNVNELFEENNCYLFLKTLKAGKTYWNIFQNKRNLFCQTCIKRS